MRQNAIPYCKLLAHEAVGGKKMKTLSTLFLRAILVVIVALSSGLMNLGIDPYAGGLVLTGPRASAAEVIFNPFKLAANLVQAAAEKAKEVIEESNLASIISGMTGVYDLLVDQFQELNDAMKESSQAKNAALQVDAVMEITSMQAQIDAATSNTLLKAQLDTLSQGGAPKGEYLCKKIVAHQLTTTTQDFEKEVSRMAAEAISNRYRCPTCDGWGPDYVGKESARRCAQGYGNPSIDGAKASCEKKLSDGRSLADADLAPLDEGQSYQMPKMISKAYTDSVTGASLVVSVPDPQNDQQRLWGAAWDNIFLLAGPRPTPRHGKGMKTPVGKVERTLFNHCLSSQNALIKQCTDLLAYYTRPNCEEMPALCEAQQEKCLAATGFLDLAPYKDCGKNGAITAWQGLSAHETEQINQYLCKSEQNNNNLLQEGAQHKDLILDMAYLCSLSEQAWKESVALKHENYRAATQGLQKLSTCWAAVGK